MADIKFEDALEKLEKIVSELESGELSLDDSIKMYEDGIMLAKLCRDKLEAAKKKVEILVKTADGKVEIRPFKENEDFSVSTPKQKKSRTKKQGETDQAF